MALPKVIAHFETQIVNKIDSSSVSMELAGVSTPAGNLPAGTYGFVIEEESSAKREYVVGTLSGTTFTFTQRDVSPLDATTTDASSDTSRQSHRKGASVKLSNFPVLLLVQRILEGTDQLDVSVPLEYSGAPSLVAGNQLATTQYVLDNVNGGTVSLQNQLFAGDAGETIADGELVYLKESDGEWYKVDADDLATLDGTLKGIAQGAGTDGNLITGGVLVEGLDNTISYTAGQLYYASNTAGGLSTSAGTNSFVVGVGDANNKLVLLPNYYIPTGDEKGAMTGASSPSSTNPFKTKKDGLGSAKTMTAGETINGATLPVAVYQSDSDNEFYACDANDTAKMKFLGFAISNGTDGNDLDVQFSGVVSGFSSLDEGEKYYVQDDQTIGTTAGTYEILVGVAISTTELLIQKGGRRASGEFTVGTNGASEAITCGFRPTRVRIYASGASAAHHSVLDATWEKGDWNSVAVLYNDASEGVAENNERLYHTGTGNYMTFTIGSVTDTGFTITYTETGSFDASAVAKWEAEGEL